MEPARRLTTPAGIVTIRPERETDASFLFALFAANAAVALRHAAAPPTVIDALIAMQHRAQAASYTARFPDALRSVVDCGCEPVGRLVEHDETDAIYIVDIAVLPAAQARGIGSAVVGLVTARASEQGRGVWAQVRRDNAASLAMFRHCGFAPRESGARNADDTVSVEMAWCGAS